MAYGHQIVFCVDPAFVQKLYREKYFRVCTLGAKYARVGGGTVKKLFFKISLFEQRIEHMMRAHSEQTQKNQIDSSKQSKNSEGAYVPPKTFSS